MEYEKLGCHSDDPDNDKHNWPEYSENEGGDEVSACKCGVLFFGFLKRTECYECHSNVEFIAEWFEDEIFMQTVIEHGLSAVINKATTNAMGAFAYIADKRFLEDGKNIAALVKSSNGKLK